jgi:hypothetical protein
VARRRFGRLLLGSLAVLVAVWGILGWFDLGSQAEAGFQTNSSQRVTAVDQGSPAAAAGLLAGDQVLEIGGHAAGDARALAQLPRAKAGETRVFKVEREGTERDVSIVYSALAGDKLKMQRLAMAVGFCFVLFPFLALFRRASEATRILAVMGTGLSLSLLQGPFIPDTGVRAIISTASSLFVLVGMAALVHFLMVFPKRRAFLAKAYARFVIYLPALLLWLVVAWRLLFTPAPGATLDSFHGLLTGVVEGGYFLVALFLLLHNYSRTHQSERKALGLNLMLWGTVLGLLPAVIAQLATMFSPQSGLPGQAFYFVSLALIPITWARSASRV